MRDYDFGQTNYVRPPSRRRVKRKGIKVLGFLLLSCVLIPFIVLQYFFNKDQFETKPETLAITIAPSATPTPGPQNSIGLQLAVQSALEGTKGNYSVVVKNLKTDEFYFLQEHEQYQSGSLYKLWVMATAMDQMQKGTLSPSEVLSMDVAELNKRYNIASEAAELHDGKVTVTVKQALDQMITISHNYSALILAQKVKLGTIDTFLKEHKYIDSKIGQPPQTSAADIATFYEDLYKGKLADAQYTEEMISLLKRQKLNNKLPKYLPEGTIIAHKTGELDLVTHDAGIVYSDKGDYIIVVLSESTLPDAAEERIATVSKNVYEYFEK